MLNEENKEAPKRKAAGDKRKKVSVVSCNLCFFYQDVSVKRSEELVEKLYLQLYLIQIVHSNGKMFFLYPNNCQSEFLWLVAQILSYFLLQGGRVGKSLARCSLSIAVFLVEKIVSPVTFDIKRSFKR